MTEPKKSRRGVYYDLAISPYTYETPYGEIFRFSSKKKLEIFTRDVPKEIARLEFVLERNDLKGHIPAEVTALLRRVVYQTFYKHVER